MPRKKARKTKKTTSSEGEWEVEKILDKRIVRVSFLIFAFKQQREKLSTC